MAINFFIGTKHVLSISEETLRRLAKAQESLKKKSGIEVDLYGRTILYPEQSELWCTGLNKVYLQIESDQSLKRDCKSLISLLETTVKTRQVLRIDGE